MGYPHKFTLLLTSIGLVGGVVWPFSLPLTQKANAASVDTLRPQAQTQPQPIESLIAQTRSDLTDAQNERLADLITRAQRRIEAGDYPGAIALYEQSLQVDRDNPRIYSGIAYLPAKARQFSARRRVLSSGARPRTSQPAFPLWSSSQPIYGRSVRASCRHLSRPNRDSAS